MLTAGILTMIEGFSLVVWGSQPYATPPFSGDAPLAFGAILIPTQAFWVFGATALIIVALWFLIARTKLGKALRACAENPAAASLMGIDVPRMTLLSFGLATLIAALSRRHRRADHLAAIRYRPPVHDFRLRRGGDRRHRLVSGRGDRRAFSRARDAAFDRLHLLAVLERDLAPHSADRPDLAAAGPDPGRRRAAAGYARRGEGRRPRRETAFASRLAAGGVRGDLWPRSFPSSSPTTAS